MFIPENRTLLYSVLLLCYFFSWDRLCLECFAEGKTQNRKQNYSLTFRENPWSKQPRLPWKLPSGRWRRFEVQLFQSCIQHSCLCVHGFTGFTFLSSTTGRNARCVFPCLDKANIWFPDNAHSFSGKNPQTTPRLTPSSSIRQSNF